MGVRRVRRPSVRDILIGALSVDGVERRYDKKIFYKNYSLEIWFLYIVDLFVSLKFGYCLCLFAVGGNHRCFAKKYY